MDFKKYKRIFFYSIIFLFLIIFLFFFYFFNPVFYSGFLVKNNFSYDNYSFFEYNVSFFNSTTIILPYDVEVISIVFEGSFLSDEDIKLYLYYNNSILSFFENDNKNFNSIVSFVVKSLNSYSDINLNNSVINSTFDFNKSSVFNNSNYSKNNFSNNSNISIDSSSNSSYTNFSFSNNTNISFNLFLNNSNNTTNNTFNYANLTLNNNTTSHYNNTILNSTINNTFNLSNTTITNVTFNNSNITFNNSINNTNLSINNTNNNNTNNNTNINNTANITILTYGSGFFDFDNDGVVSKNDAIDFYIKNNLSNGSCTFWSVVSDKNSFFVCSGNSSCCSLYGLNSSYSDPNYFVLYYDNIKSDYGVVLAKSDNFSFSNPLQFNFTGKEEKILNVNSCGNFCNLNIYSKNLTFKTNSLFKGKIKIYYKEKNLNKNSILSDFKGKIIKYKGKKIDERILDYINIQKNSNAILNLQKNTFKEKVLIKLKNNTIKEDYITNINKYINDNNVDVIEIDDPVKTLTYDVINLSEFNKAIFPYGVFSGFNVSVCVLDSGFNFSFLDSSNVFVFNAVDGSSSVVDVLGHGSKVLFPLSVLVPNSSFYLVKVFDDNNLSFESYVLKGLDYCLNNSVDIVSLSIGSGGYNGFCDDNILAQKVNELTRNNITVIAAAGNSGDEFIAVPACASNATSVVSVNKGNALSPFTSFNQNFSLIAAAGEGILTKDNFLNDVYASGTSMSVPFVSSLAILLKEKNKTLTPIEIRKRILNTGKVYNYTNIDTNKSYTYTVINAYNALNNIITNNFTYNSSQGIGNYTKQISPYTTATITILSNDVVEMDFTTASNYYSARYSDSDYVYTNAIPTYDLNKGTYVSQTKIDFYNIPSNSVPQNAYINSVTVTASSSISLKSCGLLDKQWGSYSSIRLKYGSYTRIGSSISPGLSQTTFSHSWNSNPFVYPSRRWKASEVNNLKPGVANAITGSDFSCSSTTISSVNTDRVYMTVDYIYDGCTPPSGRDWYVPLEDNCQVSSNINIYPYKLVLYGSSGSFTIKSGGSLTVKGVDFTPDDFNGDAHFNIENGGNLIVKP